MTYTALSTTAGDESLGMFGLDDQAAVTAPEIRARVGSRSLLVEGDFLGLAGHLHSLAVGDLDNVVHAGELLRISWM